MLKEQASAIAASYFPREHTSDYYGGETRLMLNPLFFSFFCTNSTILKSGVSKNGHFKKCMYVQEKHCETLEIIVITVIIIAVYILNSDQIWTRDIS